jgi:hypothetical protein
MRLMRFRKEVGRGGRIERLCFVAGLNTFAGVAFCAVSTTASHSLIVRMLCFGCAFEILILDVPMSQKHGSNPQSPLSNTRPFMEL